MKAQLSRENWQEHLSTWETSTLTQKEYCKQNGLKLATFGTWRKRLRQPSSEGLSFINACKAQEEAPSGKMVLQFLLPNGVRIGLNEHASESLIHQLLHFSGALSCCA